MILLICILIANTSIYNTTYNTYTLRPPSAHNTIRPWEEDGYYGWKQIQTYGKSSSAGNSMFPSVTFKTNEEALKWMDAHPFSKLNIIIENEIQDAIEDSA